MRELGLRGAQIGTHVDANQHFGRIDTLNLDNASLQPVWSAAQRFNAAIFVHPWDMGEKDVTAEIERYIVNPGQACAYKVGMLKIQELRERAQRELGNKFDQRQFHDAVLKNGALPLDILEEQVNAYIQSKQASITASKS